MANVETGGIASARGPADKEFIRSLECTHIDGIGGGRCRQCVDNDRWRKIAIGGAVGADRCVISARTGGNVESCRGVGISIPQLHGARVTIGGQGTLVDGDVVAARGSTAIGPVYDDLARIERGLHIDGGWHR